MSSGYIISILLAYFGLLYVVSRVTSRKTDSATFFIANRKAPWILVAYGMVGVGISGITFISVPGQVIDMQFSYFVMVIGYVIGLLIVAFVFLPFFYRINAVSIYSFLKKRFGNASHKTGAILFLMAQTTTAAFKLFLMAYVLQIALFDALEIPFWITVGITLLLIWFYTYRGGIKTVIFTDTLQTTFLIAAVVLSLFSIASRLNMSAIDMYQLMDREGISKVFFWEWNDPKNFFKLLFVGIFLTVMANGLDQSIMQKHLTCKNLVSSQKNIVTLSVILLGVNFLFLILGGALNLYSTNEGIPIPEQTDNLYPELALNHLGLATGTFFLIGIAAAAYSSADSSLTGLTTSFCVDLMNFNAADNERKWLRHSVHFGFSALIFILIIVFKQINNESVLYAFIRTTGFIYGPLLGVYIFGFYSKRSVKDWYIPAICIISPILSFIIDINSEQWLNGYEFGYDILLLNLALALSALFLLSRKETENEPFLIL